MPGASSFALQPTHATPASLMRVQGHAAWAIASLAAGSVERTAVIVAAGAMPPLKLLLQSTEKDLQVWRTWAVTVTVACAF